jgi:hypothetical protein
MSTDFREFPKWLYNKDGHPMRVESKEQEINLGAAWQFLPDGSRKLPAAAESAVESLPAGEEVITVEVPGLHKKPRK